MAALGKLPYGPVFIISPLTGISLGVEICQHAHVGYVSYVNHLRGIHIGDANIGNNCNISSLDPLRSATIPVVTGNSLVARDASPFSVLMGVPATVVSHKGSFTQVTNRGMAEDPSRSAALTEQQATRSDAVPERSSP